MSLKLIIILTILFQIFSSCEPSRPAWWKYQSTVMNWGQSQAHSVTKKAVLRQSYTGPYCGCPVLWSNANHKTYEDSRIIMGIGSGGLASILPLQLNITNQTSFEGVVTSCPAVPVNGEAPASIYIATSDNRLISLNEDLSIAKWNTKLPNASDASVSSPTAWNTLIFATSNDGFFYVLDGDKGTVLWSYKIGGTPTFYSPPISSDIDNAVYVTNFDGDIYKFKAASTQTKFWEQHITPPGVKISGHTMLDSHFSIYIPCSDGMIRVLNPTNGQVSWFYDTHVPGSLTGTSLSFDGKLIYFADSQGNFYAVSIETHQKVWDYDLPGPATTPPVVAAGETIYIGFGRGFADAGVAAFNRDGVVWNVSGNMKGLVSYLACGEDGTVYAVDGKELIAIK